MRRLAPLLLPVVFLLAMAEAPENPQALSPAPPLTPASGGHISTGDPRNPAIMPLQRIDLKFTHRRHLEEVDLKCTDCHENITKSKDASDFNIPPKSKCMDCHDATEIPSDWSPASGKDSAISMPAAHLHFSHAKHLAVDGIKCTSCHPNVAKEDVATRDDLPSMETCLSCHDGTKAPNDCRTCHLKGRAGTIKTVYDSGELKPDDHGPLWLRQHHIAAERDMGLCASCHSQEDCLTCHDGSIPPSFHEGNYIAVHPQDAMANNPPCASCHRLERFCADCHFKAQVFHEHPLMNGEFHPAGWTIVGDPNHHSNIAKKDIGTCATCHHSDDCAACHAFYLGAPETHPPGWAQSTRMQRLQRANPRLCLECHGRGEAGDPIPPP